MVGSYSNPIIRGYHPDPSICRVGEDYYLATSSFQYLPGVPIYHSKDLIHWRLIGHALTRPIQYGLSENTWRKPDIYAPTLRYHGGTFYLITSNINGIGNYYITTSDPAANWSDPIMVDKEIFDPSLCFDGDGKVYYTRRGPWESKGIAQAEIDIATGKLLTEMKIIAHGMVSDDVEGPHLYHIGDWYYLVCAEGGSRFLHMATVGRSRTPWGPFDSCPWNPFLAQHHAWWHPLNSLGHADLFEAHDGSWWMVFLGVRHPEYNSFGHLGRETFLAPISWKDEWPVVDPQAMISLKVEANLLPQHSWEPEPTRDDFDTPELNKGWYTLIWPDPKVISLKEKYGYLSLTGQKGTLTTGDQPAMVCCHQKDFRFECTSRLVYPFQTEGEEAGLTIYQSNHYHYDLFITTKDTKPYIHIRKQVGDICLLSDAYPIKPGPVGLKIVGDENKYHFCVSSGTEIWKEVGEGLTHLISSEVAATWTGAMLGMYACHPERTCKASADFDWFEYQSLD